MFLFADDTAVIIHNVAQLVDFKRAFNEYYMATALFLKAEKCVIVPLLREGDDGDPCAAYRNLVTQLTPEWSFHISMDATYLGVPVEPGVTAARRWREPTKKFVDRATGMARSSVSPAAVARHIVMFAAPIM